MSEEYKNESSDYEYIFSEKHGKKIDFGVALKILPTKGNLVYEYNPFRNYRLTETKYSYNNKLFSPKELLKEIGLTEFIIGEDSIKIEDATELQCLTYIELHKNWKEISTNLISEPTLLEAGELIDFETDELEFDINHPVDILPLYSYDNSVNLIINDGKNIPRLINSRFSATSKNEYLIVDRKGNNDTNIYDLGSQFDIDTSLYKRVVEIPRLRFLGVFNGGQMPIGDYHFYFKYADADGNETDFIAESGLVSVFIGNDPSSIKTGFRDENSHKIVLFLLTNIDSAYQYVTVYYTRSTSDINLNKTTNAIKIELKFVVNNFLKCDIVITGYEQTSEITLAEINPYYLIASSVETQASCQNMLFLGNIQRPNIPYNDLEDVSLRFEPHLNNEEKYPLEIDNDYNIKSLSQGYYDPKYIYNKVGYWNHEIYRFGVVYIMSDNSLSPVFNIRGILNLSEKSEFSKFPLFEDNGKRKYITIEENSYKILPEDNNSILENSKGVVSLNSIIDGTKQPVLGILIKCKNEVIDYLKQLKIKGFFFVRLKRIPTTLCLAYTIGIDKQSKTPVLPIEDGKFISERFLDDDQILNQDFNSRKYIFENDGRIRTEGAICPEYDVDSPYYNSLFTGDKFVIQESDFLPENNYLNVTSERNFYVNNYKLNNNNNLYSVKIIGVEDNTKLVAIGDNMFSARAGEAEEGFRYEYIEKETKLTKATNLLRGSFGPYLGITGYSRIGKLIDIKIPGYDTISTDDLFKIRYNDKSSFYAISDRIALKEIDDWIDTEEDTVTFKNTLYRGDCYICQFTHRVNRNFQDPASPINDKVVDEECWKDNYEVDEGTVKTDKFDKINLGDLNAIKMGMWVTLMIRSSKNLNIRSVDDSMVDESTMFGHGRGFYPLFPISAEGSYKIPEALCYNKGFETTVSERYNFELPDVPAIKNDFTNRIAYSDIHINDAFKNGFRVFLGDHYRDYPKTYGSITKIIEFRGNIICVFEHGVALISVNERAVAGEGSGGNIYINTSNVLPENPVILSDTFGSQWKDSVIKTPKGIYGVDTIGKKIWRTNGNEFECISDFKIQEFLNNNITLTERENVPIIGIRNVKTHYNKFKLDVMFTFYDNLNNNEECVWNICYNETLSKWITFYSWVPSYSENINNQFFSFDRNTSKWIAKLGMSKSNNYFSDKITISNNIIANDATPLDTEKNQIGKLDITNINILQDGKEITKKFKIVSANIRNWEKYFEIKENILYLKIDATELCSEYYVKGIKDGNTYKLIITDPVNLKLEWIENCVLHSNYITCLDDSGKPITLNINGDDKRINGDNPVYLLNIEGTIIVDNVNNGTYKSTIAIIPQYNKQFLTTDFWKHGQAGIIDVSDKIYPTFWYGKQHPFEFEFVVADNPMVHKIYDNLEIISNKAEPESFHYEIIGECYDFAKDKKNMYIRQEATKDLYRLNGVDISYDHNYINLKSEHRKLFEKDGKVIYDKSTLFPLYYSRTKSVNNIEDYYHRKKGETNSEDFSALAGAEIVKYDNLNEYRIWNHCEAVDLSKGRLRGNMQYKEDKWDVLINPINLIQENENLWLDINGNPTDKIPIELNQNPIPDILLTKDEINTTSDGRGVTLWNNPKLSEAKLKDKFIKIRIRYSGKDLAIINAIKTFYSASYS